MQDTGKYGFGVNDTLQLMEMSAVETLIVWENLDIDRLVLKNTSSGDEVIKFLNKEQQQKPESFRCGPATTHLSRTPGDRRILPPAHLPPIRIALLPLCRCQVLLLKLLEMFAFAREREGTRLHL